MATNCACETHCTVGASTASDPLPPPSFAAGVGVGGGAGFGSSVFGTHCEYHVDW